MTCPSCKALVPDGYTFCPSCGQDLGDSSAVRSAPARPSSTWRSFETIPNRAVPPAASSRLPGLIALASLLGLFIVSVLLALHFLFKTDYKNDQEQRLATAPTPSPVVVVVQESRPTEAVPSPSLVRPDLAELDYRAPTPDSSNLPYGAGTGTGIGTGRGGGIVPGEGGGIGPGRGGGIGSDAPHESEPGGVIDYNKVFTSREVTSRPRITFKPEPVYTEEARRNQVVGTVVLRAVLSADGQVTNIKPVSGLPYGLTERAIAAARQMRFTPATKDGRAVSMYIQLEYNFNLY